MHSVTPSLSSVNAGVDYLPLVFSQCVGVEASLLTGNFAGSFRLLSASIMVFSVDVP